MTPLSTRAVVLTIAGAQSSLFQDFPTARQFTKEFKELADEVSPSFVRRDSTRA